MNLREFRETIPVAVETTYLNTGSSSPSSVDVVESMQALLEHHGYEAPTGDGMHPPVYEAFEETRRAVAGLLNARPGEAALTQSTGDGVRSVRTCRRRRLRNPPERPLRGLPRDETTCRSRTTTRESAAAA